VKNKISNRPPITSYKRNQIPQVGTHFSQAYSDPQSATGPAFASSVGLALFAAYPQDEWWDFEMPVDSYPARSLRRAVRWFRENW